MIHYFNINQKKAAATHAYDMKNLSFPFLAWATFLAVCLLTVSSCKKDEDPEPPCKLSAIDRGNGNKHAYTYDASGKITQMAREFDGTGSGNISKYVYTFTYDAAGLLTKSTYTLNGKPNGSETYAYTNGRVSKATFESVDGTKGMNNIKYNSAGRITEYTFEVGDPATDGKQYFEYDANGVITKSGFADLKGNKFFEVLVKVVGMSKSPENLLANNGLPYDVLTGYSWGVAEGGVGTTYETFYEEDGKLVSAGIDKITDVKTNAKGYLTEWTIEDAAKVSTKQQFTLADCN